MYCSGDDLITRFGSDELIQLSDHDNTGAINTTVVDQAITDASAEIDGYISSAYDLPLTETPALLNLYACDIARYRLFGDGAFEAVIERYNIALKYLRDIASGKVQLIPTTTEDDAENGAEFENGRESVFLGGGF
jgi:phage gp36-like protein